MQKKFLCSQQLRYMIRKANLEKNGPTNISIEELLRFFEEKHGTPEDDDEPFVLNFTMRKIAG